MDQHRILSYVTQIRAAMVGRSCGIAQSRQSPHCMHTQNIWMYIKKAKVKNNIACSLLITFTNSLDPDSEIRALSGSKPHDTYGVTEFLFEK